MTRLEDCSRDVISESDMLWWLYNCRFVPLGGVGDSIHQSGGIYLTRRTMSRLSRPGPGNFSAPPFTFDKPANNKVLELSIIRPRLVHLLINGQVPHCWWKARQPHCEPPRPGTLTLTGVLHVSVARRAFDPQRQLKRPCRRHLVECTFLGGELLPRLMSLRPTHIPVQVARAAEKPVFDESDD